MYLPLDTYSPNSDPNALTIVGALFGLGEVTSRMQAQASVANGNLDITANVAMCSHGIDTFPEHVKVQAIVYLYGNKNMEVSITEENSNTAIN